VWRALLDKLAEEAVARGLASPADAQAWKRIAGRNARQAASLIRGALGEPVFAEIMYATFRRKTGRDGRHYTAAHSAIVRLPLRGVVTTNYDPGLVEARHEQRPETTTAYGVWKQDGACREWLHRVPAENDLPILFGHGTHDWAESLVLSAESYREAYGRGAYRWARLLVASARTNVPAT
jgi:hypothetical protein